MHLFESHHHPHHQYAVSQKAVVSHQLVGLNTIHSHQAHIVIGYSNELGVTAKLRHSINHQAPPHHHHKHEPLEPHQPHHHITNKSIYQTFNQPPPHQTIFRITIILLFTNLKLQYLLLNLNLVHYHK